MIKTARFQQISKNKNQNLSFHQLQKMKWRNMVSHQEEITQNHKYHHL